MSLTIFKTLLRALRAEKDYVVTITYVPHENAKFPYRWIVTRSAGTSREPEDVLVRRGRQSELHFAKTQAAKAVREDRATRASTQKETKWIIKL